MLVVVVVVVFRSGQKTMPTLVGGKQASFASNRVTLAHYQSEKETGGKMTRKGQQ